MNEEKIKEIVMELMAGNQTRFSELYNLTIAKATAVAKKYLKDSTETEDVLQDSYIASLDKIGTLEKPESYQSWLNQIVARRCLNVIRKNDPVMFSEMTSEDDDDTPVDFEDETVSFSPEKITDIKATASAVEEVMNLLPEFQRDALWMHYGQDISIKDIAEAAGVSENTIKSRLKQGRDKLYKMQDEFKKRGIEVTGITIAVLLYTIFSSETDARAAEISQSADFADKSRRTLDAITRKAASKGAGAAAKTAASVATKAGLSAGAKIGIFAAVVAGVVGVSIGSMNVVANRRDERLAREEQQQEEASSASESESTSSSSEEQPDDTSTSSSSEEEEDDTYAEAIAAYREVLDGVSSLGPFEDNVTPTGYYMYALVTMKDGEGPTMLLSQEGSDGVGGYDNVRIYYYDTDEDKMYQTSEAIETGVFGGGARVGIDMEPDGNGIREQGFMSTDPEVTVTRYTRDGNKLVSKDQGTYDMSKDSIEEGKTIQWHSIGDTSAFDKWPEEAKATGDDGYPSDYGKAQSASTKPKKKKKKKSINGTYTNADGFTHTVKKNSDGSVSLDGNPGSFYDEASGEYQNPEVEGGFSIDTSKNPYELHIYGEYETIYKKVD